MKLGLKVKDRENKEEKNNTEEEIDKKIAELLSGGDEKNRENTSENRFKFIKRPKKTRKIINRVYQHCRMIRTSFTKNIDWCLL